MAKEVNNLGVEDKLKYEALSTDDRLLWKHELLSLDGAYTAASVQLVNQIQFEANKKALVAKIKKIDTL